MTKTVAALFVHPSGVYSKLPFVDLWDAERDARLYPGTLPVIAHPPCARWGRFWSGGLKGGVRYQKGDDGGCFEAALQAVRSYGGALEHPEASAAWDYFDLNRPPKDGGWVVADWAGGWTCCVDQGWYGHLARKPTWLYVRHTDLPILRWGTSKLHRKGCTHLSHNQREATPIPFRDVLLEIAMSVKR